MNLRDNYGRALQAYSDDAERARMAELNKRPAPNPPELLALVRVRVLRPFYVAGRVQEIGATIEIQRHDALSLAAIGKLVIIKGENDAKPPQG